MHFYSQVFWCPQSVLHAYCTICQYLDRSNEAVGNTRDRNNETIFVGRQIHIHRTYVMKGKECPFQSFIVTKCLRKFSIGYCLRTFRQKMRFRFRLRFTFVWFLLEFRFNLDYDWNFTRHSNLYSRLWNSIDIKTLVNEKTTMRVSVIFSHGAAGSCWSSWSCVLSIFFFLWPFVWSKFYQLV